MENYRLAIDGDYFERQYWDLFIQKKFPNYEKFWLKYIVPLTNRPDDIHFKSDVELAKIGKSADDICIAQLHYSLLIHLIRTFDILRSEIVNLDNLTEGIVRLSGALDVAFELLERHTNPGHYDPWIENGKNSGEEARRLWQRKTPYSLKEIRNYRNHLVHGRMMPSTDYLFPKIGLENKYFDWRWITDPVNNPGLEREDFAPARNILFGAWKEVLGYLDDQWRKHLLK